MSQRCLVTTIALTGCLLFGGTAARAAGPRESLMVTPSWLSQHLRDPNLIVLTVGEETTYKREHIPGAQFVTLDTLAAPMDRSKRQAGDLTLEMPTAERMHEQLEKLGISNNSTIVVYYSDEYFSPSTRTILALNYAGLGNQTVLLDGGLRAWKAAGHPTTADLPNVKRGQLQPLTLHTDLIVDASFVQTTAKTSGYALVDGRSAGSYDGVVGQRNGQAGHIPGALNVSFDDLFNDREELRSAEELERFFTKAGVKPGDTVVGYCWVGQIATGMLFAARTLGHPVKLYDGSINDWVEVKKLPLEKTIKGGGAR